jgi:RHS repeat-associated protein
VQCGDSGTVSRGFFVLPECRGGIEGFLPCFARGGGVPTYTYAYDRYGNRWQQNGPYTMLLTFNTNSQNQMDGYSYDAAANLLNDGNHSYTYDAENRIIQVDNGQIASYVYDGDGQRVQKTASSVVAQYLLDLSGDTITELNSSGVWTRGEVYAGGRHLATYGGGSTGTTYFIQTDWLGSERARALPNGDVAETCTSLSYGDGQTCTGVADPSPNHFTGKQRDSESGLDQFGARYYANSMGRFMIPDWAARATAVPYAEFGDPQTLNLYAYVRNNPLFKADADGHGDAGTFCNTQCRYGTPVSEGELQVEKGIVELTGAAIAGPEVLAAASEATTILQGLGVAVVTLGVTGTAVNGTVDIAGGLTHTNVDAGTNAVTSVTNPVAAGVSIATGSMEKGSQAADLTTVVKAGVNLAQGKGVSNPAEVAGSLAGAKAAVQGVYNTAKSVISGATAPAPPPPPTPKPPSCSDAGACK